MNKSTTNRNLSNQPDVGIVSRSELGKRVLVNGHFGGILRYMGPVQGKLGIFFGVELDQPVGKNDGTHQGTFYFQCRPGHGVFAPCHKIELEGDSGKGSSNTENNKNNRENQLLLSRSAMPSLSPAKNTNVVGQPAPMEWSLMSMSTGSTNSGGSLVAKFLDDDLMAHSHATYTVFESDCLMLSDLELSDSTALLRFDEEEDRNDKNDTSKIGVEEEWTTRNFVPAEQRQQQQNRIMDESMVLDGPTLFAMDLPVIGTPDSALVDETPTPMAEQHNRNFETGLAQMINWEQQQQRERVVDRRNRNNLALNGLGLKNGGGGNEENTPSTRKNSPNNNSNSGGLRQTPTTEMVKASGRERRRKMMMANAKGGEDLNNNDARNNNNRENSSTNAMTGEDNNSSGGRGKSREKKPRVSVFQSIPMPNQNLSAAARSKPKQPTKAQLVMEQLKASMEAEKQRPKKEIRSKLQPPTPTNSVKEKEEIKTQLLVEQKVGIDVEKQQSTNKEIRSIKLSAASNIVKEKEGKKGEENDIGQDVKNANTINNQRMKKAGNKIQSIGLGARRVLSGHSTHQQTSTTDSEIAKLKQQLDQLKQQLERREHEHAEQLEKQLTKSKVEQANAEAEIAKLKQQFDQRKSEHAEQLEQQLANNKAEQTEAIEKLECSWQAKLTEAEGKHEKELTRVRFDLSTVHLDELQTVRAQHQKAMDELSDRLNLLTAQMAEQAAEYEVKMKESESTRNRRLNDELASLQFALQLKNEEVQKLRGENRELIIQTEKIAEKDAQITKFGKKNEDLKDEVNRLKQIERSLISQLNELRRELDESRTKCKEMGMEREVLEYQLQEQIERGSDSTTPLSTPKMAKYREFSPHGSRTSHHLVNIRTPDPQQKSTPGRPNSSCWPSQGGRSTELEGDMSKSMDSAMSQSVISCYRQEGRSKSQNTPNKIYTPRELYTYEANDLPSLPPSSAAKRTVEFENCGDDSPTKTLLDPAEANS